jgi:hypothetical protein
LRAARALQGDPEVFYRLPGLARDVAGGDDTPVTIEGQAPAENTIVAPVTAAT